MEWRPIETALKGVFEEPILGWHGGHVYIMYSIREDWVDEHGWRLAPTHWMPLPEPPKE